MVVIQEQSKSKTSLAKWSKQKWRTKSGKPSSKTGERYLPAKAIKSLSAREYARTSAKKRRDKASGKQFSKQPKSIARKVKDIEHDNLYSTIPLEIYKG